jgi:hypothetical protein
MSANPEMNVQMNGGLAESLLQVNQLSYRLPPQISIASKTTHVINYSQQSNYNGGNTVIFDIQTGSAFVDPMASYFRFVVKPSASGFGFGSGSVCNIFNRCVVRTATGKELSRVEDANLLCKILDVYNNSNDWRVTMGESQGYTNDVMKTEVKYTDEVPTGGRLFVIPIQCLLPCMSPHGAKLVPPNIMSGLRIELSLASAGDAFCSVNQTTLPTNPLASYTIDDVEIHLKTHELADAFARKIQEMSVQGLNYLYKEHFHNIVSPGANSQINFDVKKACSKALTARILTRTTATISNTSRDHMASAPFNYIKYQSHIGSDYFPNQPLQLSGTPTRNNINESYYYTMYAQDKLEKWSPPGVTPAQYLGDLGGGTVSLVYASGIVAFNFNKSNVSDLAGYTVSNSRSLLVDLQQATATDVRLDVYLTFLRLAKVYQSNCVVLD